MNTYAQLYLREKIQAEQLIRDMEPFREFLGLAGQMNGKVINALKMGRDVGVDSKTIKKYFGILEDTWLGFTLPNFSRSIRKSQKSYPKFYLFDHGVARALCEVLDDPIRESTSTFGQAFEHWVILEIFRLRDYLEKSFRMSFLQTREGDGEIDLILSKGASVEYAIEIKSATRIDAVEVRRFKRLAQDLNPRKMFFLSRDPIEQKVEGANCKFWENGISEIFR